MFARVLTGSKDKPAVCTKFLCDTGNLGRSLVSEKFAQSLKWQTHPCKHSIKAAEGSKVTILGETNDISFIVQGHEATFKWRFLVIRNLCAPGVFGIDFFNNFNVGIKMNKSGINYLTFGDQGSQIVPLVSPNAPNLPPNHDDNRFVGARVFRQHGKSMQTAAVLQGEVGKESDGRPPGRPPDTRVTTPLREGVGNPISVGSTPLQEANKGNEGKAEEDEGKTPTLMNCEAGGAEVADVPKPDTADPSGEDELGNVLILKPEKKVKIEPHYRVWVKCRTPEGTNPSMAVLVDDEAMRGNPGRKQGVHVVEAINYMRDGRVSVLVENTSDQPVRLGLSYQVANAHPMLEPEVDWARGHYSIDQVCFALQQEREGSTLQQECEENKAWPTDEQLKSRGPNSWWDPCQGMTEAERMIWVEEAFKLNENEYLKKHPQWRIPYLSTLARYTDCVAGKGHVEAIPETTWVSMSLDTVPGARPIHQRPRPLSPPDQADLDRQLAVWLRQRVIVPAVEGAWALNLVPVRKKGVAAGVRRWTVDARGINSISEPRPEYIGSVGSNLEQLADMSLFCQLDLSNAFLSIPIRPDHVHKASFVTPKSGAFSMTRSGYGFKNSPAALERLGTAIMRPIPNEKGSKYMDDFLLKDTDPASLLKTLCTFLDQIRAANVKIQASKCNILATRVIFLGHLVVGSVDEKKQPGLYPDPELLSTILNTPVPECPASLKRYLGQLAFYSQFLVGISAATASLHQAKNRIPFKLTDSEVGDFKQSLKMLASSPALSFPDFSDVQNRPFILAGDFSPVACNASLHQYQRGGLRLLGAVGRTNKGAAQRWGSMRGEAASVRLGTDKWRHILLRFWFPIITDNLSLTHARSMKDPTGFWSRFLEHMSQFNITFIHRSGVDGPVEDAWSRMAHHPEWTEQEKYNLADYEDENDEEKGPGVPRNIPIGLRELLSKRSIGLDKPWEVQGASHLDKEKGERDKVTEAMASCSLQEATVEQGLKQAVQELQRRAPEVAQKLMALATQTAAKADDKPKEKMCFFSDFAEDYLDLYDPDAEDDGFEEPLLTSTSSSSESEEENSPSGGGDQRWSAGVQSGVQVCSAPQGCAGEQEQVACHTAAAELDDYVRGADGNNMQEAEHSTEEDQWVNVIRPEFRTVRAIPSRLSLQQKAIRQRANPTTREVMKWVQAGKKPTTGELRGRPRDLQAYANIWELLHLVNGILYAKSELGGEKPDRWCVPANSIADVLDIAHVADAKHMATESTINRVNKVAWWPSMRQDTEDFVLACPGCRPKHAAPKGHLLALHKPRLQSRPNQCCYLDLVGPLNTSTTGMRYIFTCLDGFSRYVSAIPIKDKKSETVISCLRAVVNVWGIMEEIFCDHGKEFDNQFMRQEARKLGIKQYFAVSYEARSNKVERYHRVQGALLRSALAETNDYENWPKYVPEVVRAYNTSVHAVTKFTPHRLQTGREYSGPLQAWIGPPEDEEDISLEEREKQRVRRRTLDELEALTNQSVYQKRQSSLYQNKPTFKPEVGQKVFIHLPVAIKADNAKGFIAKKLSSGWCGPWKTTERITDQIYRVSPMDGDLKQSRVVSVDRMEPYREGHRYDSATTAVPLSPDHPLVRRANNDPHAENIIQSKANEDDAANPWWPYSTYKEEEVPVPAMPQQQSEGPDGELLPPMPPSNPADEVWRDAESEREGGGPHEAAPSTPPHSDAEPRRLGARPKWPLRVRFKEPPESPRCRSPSTATERRRRREEEVSRRRGMEEAREMAELKPREPRKENGGEEDEGGAGEAKQGGGGASTSL